MPSIILRHPSCALWSIRGPSARDSILLPVLAIPTLRARVERDVHRRAVTLAPHVQSAPISFLLPRNLRFARSEGIADFVGNLLRKRRIRVNRPAAEIERVGIPSEAREAGFRKGNFPPSEPSHGIELGRLKLDRREAGRQRLIEPDLDALVEHRIDLATAKRPKRRTSDGPPQRMRRPPHDSMSLSAKPWSANA